MEFMLCRLIVGRPYPLSAQSLQQLMQENAEKKQKAVPVIPKGYNSIFIQKNAPGTGTHCLFAFCFAACVVAR
jgi:hypothetical protein